MARGKRPWPSSWDCVATPNSDEEAAHLVARSHVRFAMMTDKIRKAFQAGDVRKAKDLGRLALHSDSARISATAHALTKKYSPDPTPGLSLAIIQDALGISMWKDSGEQVLWDVYDLGGKPKVNYSYGLLEFTRQKLAARVARAMADLSPRQFILQGGMPALVAWMQANVPNSKVVITTDVPNCFFALNRECVEAGMPLPGRVTRSVLFDPMDRAKRRAFVPGSSAGNSYTVSPAHYGCGVGSAWGIPRGSALASLAAELCLRPILEAVEGTAEGVTMAIYGDNIIILASSKKAADASISALRAAALQRISEHAVEGLCTRIVTSTPKKGFLFVNSRFRVRKGVLERRALPGFAGRFEANLATDLHHHDIDKVTARRRVLGWAASHSFEPNITKTATRIMIRWGLLPKSPTAPKAASAPP